MKDVPELRAHLQELAGSAPSAKPIDARARRKIRVRRSIPIAVTALSVLALATTGFALSAHDTDRSSNERAAGGQKGGCVWRIATLVASSGGYAPLGEPIVDAVGHAVEEANERGGLACRVELRADDSKGNPNATPGLARRVVEDDALVACVCPYFASEIIASGRVFDSAGVLMTATATNTAVDEQGFRTWFGAAAPDDVLGEVAGEVIASTGADNVAVIGDGQDYPKTLTAAVQRTLGERVGGTFTIDLEPDDFSRVVDQVEAMEADFVFFGGYTPEAGPLIRQLRQAGVEAPFMAGPGTKYPVFGELAEEAAGGALAVCACADPAQIDSAAAFVEGMREAHGPESPGEFGVETYDVATLVVEALRTYEGDPADNAAVRAHVVAHFDDATGFDGLAKTYSWDDDGRLEARSDAVWIYEWDAAEGAWVAGGPASDYLD